MSRSTRQLITGLALVGYLVLLTVGVRTSSPVARIVLVLFWLAALGYLYIDRGARLAAARCPHDDLPLTVMRRLPRAQLSCPYCERRYSMYGPQLHESKPSGG